MSESEDIKDGITWLASNKGFVSTIAGFGGVIIAIIVTCVVTMYWGTNLINAMDKRITLNEKRLEIVEENAEHERAKLLKISEEQLRRTEPVATIKAMEETLKRVERKLEEKK